MATDGDNQTRLIGGIGSSGVLFLIAGNAYKRSNSNVPGEYDAIVAIVFWAMYLEAFINEKISHAMNMLLNNAQDPEGSLGKELCTFAHLGKWAYDQKARTATKYHAAKLAFTGRPYKEGARPFQDLGHLIDLRNMLVHMRIEKILAGPNGTLVVTHPSVTNHLENLKVIDALPPDAPAQSFLGRINTPLVARWAYDTATEMVQDVVKDITNPIARAVLQVDSDLSLIPESDE